MNVETREPRDEHYEIVSLCPEHLTEAAALFVAGYREARAKEPSLPAGHENPPAILPKLRDLAAKEPGVAAVRDGRIAGFLLGQVLPTFRGNRSVYVPEWAHAAVGEQRAEIYRGMYARLSPRWVADACFAHLITTLANDPEAKEAWFWLGFGMIEVDAVRDLGPIQCAAADVEVRRAQPEDIEPVLEFARGIQRHMAAAPMFVPLLTPVEKETVERRLADPAQAIFLACRNAGPVAYVHVQPANPSAAYVIQDEKTASIRGAFTRPAHRGKGIGAALLGRAIDWARSAGYERCAVDFEPQNIPGTRFWLRHFRPVCHSMVRHVDKTIAPADGRRADNKTPARGLLNMTKNDFIPLDPGELADGNLQLVLHRTVPWNEEKQVGGYGFDMVRTGTAEPIGHIVLRVGNTEHIVRYAGHVGFSVDPAHRGHRYAARACRLLLPLAKRHGVNPLWITCDPGNIACRRTCEIAGAQLVETVSIPEGTSMYAKGERQKCRYRLDL